MPRYDYRCAACGREVEVVHGIHEAGPTVCEVCGGPMRKALSAPAIHFKGSGWAKKDARAAVKPAAAGAGSKDPGAAAATGAASASGEGGTPAAGGSEPGPATSKGGGAADPSPGKSGSAKAGGHAG
jgi:putative FmdB family regulatory protein